MKKHLVAIAILAASLVIPTPARAEKWYQNGWFIGSTAALGGGIVGYALGKHHGSRNTYVVGSPAYSSGTPYDYSGTPVHMTGAYYVRDKRAFPFYSKTEVYPIASTMPLVERPQAVSLATSPWLRPGWEPVSAAGIGLEDQRPSEDITIEIGDNNQDVSITINKGGADGAESALAMKTETVSNNEKSLPGRMVDIKVPVETPKVESTEAEPVEEIPARK